ncbi:MAG: putative metal-binding motif-containing protein, partial [Polyangiales bacterium]
MSALLQTHPSCAQRSALCPVTAALAFAALLALTGCGDITCPEPLSAVEGVCLKLDPVAGPELCDGADNDGDTEVDEDWPNLGEPCGESEGECAEGVWVCAAGGDGVVCEGGVGPSAEVCDEKDNDCDGTPDNGPDEVCDGVDNDCDGLIDEGVLATKSELFGGHATVAAVEGGFAVARAMGDLVRVETYDVHGEPSGASHSVDSNTESIAFMTSQAAGDRVLIGLGQYTYHVLDVRVDSGFAPIVLSAQELHADWKQGRTIGAYTPPLHPRVVASPARFVGYRDVVTFALSPFAGEGLLGLTEEPVLAPGIPLFTEFDAAGFFVIWKQSDKLRTGWLLDDGSLLLDIDVARGEAPGIALAGGGPGVSYLQDGAPRLSELSGTTLQCRGEGFCNELLDAEALQGLVGPTALAQDETRDTWFVVAGDQAAVVHRGADGALVTQTVTLEPLRKVPNRVEVVVSNGTAAVVHSEQH